MKHFRFLLLSGLLGLVGCGEMFMQKQEEKKMSQLLSCSADPSALSKIFTENIQGDLACLGESLNLFVEIVKTDRPGNLSYKELTAFIGKNMEEVDTNLFEPLKGFFEINSLLSGDHPLYIKKDNIKKLVGTLKLINKVMVKHKVFEYFTSDNPVSYQEHSRRKAEIFNAFASVEQALTKIYQRNDNSLDLSAFVKKFKNVDNSKILQNSEKLLFIKKIFLGGDKKTLTAKEAKRLMLMLADASKIAYDIVHLPSVVHTGNEQEEILESLKEDFETISLNLYSDPLVDEPMMTLDDIQYVVREHFPQAAEFMGYEEAILQGKRIFLKNDAPFFTASELQKLFDIVLFNLKRGAFFFKAYAANKSILDRKTPIYRDLPTVIASNSLEEEFKADFNRIAKDYWFFLDQDWMASYKNEIERSPWGMFLTATMEDLVQRVFSHYVEKSSKAYGGYSMPRSKIQTLLEDFKSFLNEKELILPGREVNSAETIELMTALFQKQSDGNGDDIEVNETVELLTTMISGFRMSERFYEETAAKCALDSKGRFMPSCMKDHFAGVFDMEVAQNGKTFDIYMPKLAEYVRGLDQRSSDVLVGKMNIFTRTCSSFSDGTPVPVSRGDTFMFFAGLINIESTYTRFDRGGAANGGYNNILEVSELNRAYDNVYEEAIEAKVPAALAWRARDVFFYLLDKGKEPGVLEMIFRIVPAGYAQKSADRSSVASVLKVIAEGSEANKENPANCELLR